jgi:processive 1,2-diacylglycerol beta-glucosyltransferase
MKRALILTAGYGEGHNAAARACAAGLREAGVELEVLDLFLVAYGKRQEFSRRLYLGCINHAPWLWAITYWLVDHTPLFRLTLPTLFGLRAVLARTLQEKQPDLVVSVYPAYGHLLDQIFAHKLRPFREVTVVTDSITVNSVWLTRGTEAYIVPNEATAKVLRPVLPVPTPVHALGFPVPLVFADGRPHRPEPGGAEPFRIMMMVNHGRANALALARALLPLEGVALTVTTGRDAALSEELAALAKSLGRPIDLHGWTDQMPQLLMRHHLLISKAGGAATQEAIAARTPVIFTKIVPGQEEGNAALLCDAECGVVAGKPREVRAQVERLIADDAALWRKWVKAIATLAEPDSARKIAQFLLSPAKDR